MQFLSFRKMPVSIEMQLRRDLNANLKTLKLIWGHCDDFESKVLHIDDITLGILALKTLTSDESVSRAVIEPLNSRRTKIKSLDDMVSLIGLPTLKRERQITDVNLALSDGAVVILVDGHDECLIANLMTVPTRAVDRPHMEPSILGPQEAFIEDVQTNLSLIRKRLKTPRLKQEVFRIGTLTNSVVAVLYIEATAQTSIVEEVRTRIRRVDLDGLLDSHTLTELITDTPLSIFPTIQGSERPDRVVSALLHGRIAILVDGSPIAILAPTTLNHLIQAPEDYYASYLAAAPIRALRQFAFWTSLLLPSLYVAILTFHYEMIPTRLLLTLQQAHQGIPFPTVLEAFIMEFIFEILREAGIRLPKAVGQSVSIVGTLIVGEAAVSAGIVSSGMVIIVATTGICSFSIPTYNLTFAMRVLRFPLMLFAGFMGLYGIGVYVLGILIHLVSLRSFGIPYLSPLAPLQTAALKDSVVRAPWWKMNRTNKI